MPLPQLPPAGSPYGERDRARFLPEQHENRRRSTFARDRARLVHSSALRRLAAKTQVLSPTAGLDFARNRLTHSLEVAQVGREIAASLDLDPDVVDTACLAHDLGHPPFGHNGERALAAWSDDIGGFEGNAQTLRVVTRLEPKVVGPEGEPYGLNLTRASLDATTKYPWTREEGVLLGTRKFGVYSDDVPVFAWLRMDAPRGKTCIEAQVMDLSDDIAYSVHDFEDAVMAGSVLIGEVESRDNREAILYHALDWSGGRFTADELGAALDRLLAFPHWVHGYDGSMRDQARLKNLTSQLIGRFARTATEATWEAYPGESIVRYRAEVVVPRAIHAEIAMLKGIVAGFVMSHDGRQPLYANQRELLTELADLLWERGSAALDVPFAAAFGAADDDVARRRVIVDQIASLTDQSAITWHARLTGETALRLV
ncbi:deoxyguanosinetriphosphate triphosphohydrolase-like protein [Pseudoclavibacter endophyticus]|uniref:Deoxyguanosinetriphosphate triphosphohydrolase n=1 Tax=Pseudoclavibacter endophyticus TaxID=1778590 RepID=A0A6H9WM74_9MICO|nr:deoxyguanosinetriphosphate triphosphohydrolase [Pseudoclavibacter endophyticus]KAB1649956.1 deoxyguanosinetriphosphate triphosphohydrolase [Pseudoclavibacter endophyticus]GGA58419.1 deoxyguanosinetriphosphate triphosphohydrolase-like protein [Pseudoclavibacter endophyticus]